MSLAEVVTLPNCEDRARDTGWDIIDRIVYHWGTVREHGVPNPVGPGRLPWHPLSLEAGDLGLTLVYASVDVLDPDGGWDELAHGHLKNVLAAYRTTPDLGIGLFGGTAGVAFALRALARGGTRYQRALMSVEETLVHRTMAALKALPPERGLASSDYDLVSGITGVAWYLLHDRQGSRSIAKEQLLPRILRELSRRARMLPTPGVGLATPPEGITEVEREHFPYLRGGYLNLGLAHGIAGPLAVLGAAHRQGFDVDVEAVAALREALGAACHALPFGPDCPYYALDGPDPLAGVSRTAWCYGNPGLALAEHWSRQAASPAPSADAVAGLPSADLLLASALHRPHQLRQIANPSLCHGVAGLMLVSQTAAPHVDVTPLLEEIDGYRDERATFGLRVEHTHGHVVDSPGVLEGSGGTAVALLGAADPLAADTCIHHLLLGRLDHA